MVSPPYWHGTHESFAGSTMERAKRATERDALLTATMQLIGERGLQGLTLRDVATAAEMSLGLTT